MRGEGAQAIPPGDITFLSELSNLPEGLHSWPISRDLHQLIDGDGAPFASPRIRDLRVIGRKGRGPEQCFVCPSLPLRRNRSEGKKTVWKICKNKNIGPRLKG